MDVMDNAVFRAGEYQVPGPRRLRNRQPTTSSEGIPGDLPKGKLSAAALAACTWRIKYLDDRNVYWPVQDAEVQVTGTRAFTLRTDQNGAFSLCPAIGETYAFTAYLQNADVLMVANYAAQVTGITSSTVATDVIAPSLDSRGFENMVRTAPQARALFTYSRPRMTVQVWGQSTSQYNNDKISINLTDVWGEWGIFTAAHEYGHAYENKALGGINGGVCGLHHIDEALNLQCAYWEGFADFFAVATRRSALTSVTISDYSIERDAYFPGRNYSTGAVSRDGSLIEGAVAAFFYDMVDDASWPDGPNNELNGDDDPMAYGGKYLGDVIKSCGNLVPTLTFPTITYIWQAEWNIGMLTYCLENRVTPTLPQPTVNLGSPAGEQENATEPPGWSPANIRASWVWNLMNKS
jgi:hypothetical protein